MDKKTEIPGMYKVTEGIVINKDNDALQAYKKRKRRERRLEMVTEEIDHLKNELGQIKKLLEALVNK